MNITLIIVNYFSEKLISKQLNQLKHQNLQIIVVDNSSTFDKSFENENTIILKTESNLGFGKAVNYGLKKAKGEIIVLLNPDIEIDNESIIGIANTLESDGSFGIIAPKLQEKQHSGPYINGGYWPTLRHMIMHFFLAARFSDKYQSFRGLYAHNESKCEGGLIQLDWVSAACLAIKKSDFEIVGGFNERWFIYSEDLELCLRIKSLGKKIGINPAFNGIHIGGSSNSRNDYNSRVNTLWLTNLYEFYKTFFSKKSNIRLILWLQTGIFGFTFRWFYTLIKLPKIMNTKESKKVNLKRFKQYVMTLVRIFIKEFIYPHRKKS